MALARVVATWVATGTLLVYLLMSLFEAAFGLAATVKPTLLPPSKQAHIDVLLGDLHRPTLRQKFLAALQAPSTTLAWPLWWVRNRRRFLARTNNLHFNAQLVLEPTNVLIAAATFTLLVAIDTLGRLGVLWSPFARITVIVVLCATVARHVSYLFGSSLPELLRQSRRSPYASLLAIALLDGASLVLAVTLARASDTGLFSTPAAVRESVVQFFDVTVTLGALAQLNPPEVLALPGLVFYAALINAVRSPKEFHRTDDDLRKLATYSLHIGDIDSAKSWLEREKGRTFESLFIRARLAIAQGRFDEAARLIGRALTERLLDDTSDAVVAELISLTQFTPLTDARLADFLRYLMRRPVGDPLLCAEAQTISLVAQDADGIAREALDDEAIAEFPLTQAHLLACVGDWAAAREVLDRARPGSEPEECLRLLHLCNYTCLDPELSIADTNEFVTDWFSSGPATVKALTKGLTEVYRIRVLAEVLETRYLLRTFYTYDAEEFGWYGAGYTEELTDLASGMAESEQELSTLTKRVENLSSVQLRAR